MKRWMFVLALMIIVVSACAPPTSVPPTAEAPDSPLTKPHSPISVPPTPQLLTGVSEDAFVSFRVAVAEQVGLSSDELTLVSAKQVTWRDTSLGCPQEGMSYAQVLVEGWRIVFVDVSGQEYDVRTAQSLEDFIICQQPQTDSSDGATGGISSAKDAAVNALMAHLDVARDEISIVSIEVVEWRNSCLGCSAPGEVCLDVITPGYRINLDYGGETYSVHADSMGRQVIICDEPTELSPQENE